MQRYQYIIAPVLGWLIAQGIKFVLSLRKDGLQLVDFVQSGGMPSSHSSLILALTTVIGLEQGITTVAFGITATVAGIVIYDATGVRRTTGQQTEAIKELAIANKIELDTTINNARGHSLPEVLVGSFLGIFIGVIVYAIL